MCLIPSLSNLCMIQFCIILLLFFLLANEVLNQNPKKTNFILYLFEIVLACSRGSLGTISNTNSKHMAWLTLSFQYLGR